jgi:hypothetical protein
MGREQSRADRLADRLETGAVTHDPDIADMIAAAKAIGLNNGRYSQAAADLSRARAVRHYARRWSETPEREGVGITMPDAECVPDVHAMRVVIPGSGLRMTLASTVSSVDPKLAERVAAAIAADLGIVEEVRDK